MRRFVRKPKSIRRIEFAESTKSGRAFSGQDRVAHSILQLQRTIGNQAVQRLLRSKAEELQAGPAIAAATRFGHDFTGVPITSLSSGLAQRKMTVNTPGDIYEQEADRVADEVMRMPEPQIQRACACGGGCLKCKNSGQSPGKALLDTAPARTTRSANAAAPPVVDEVPGQTGRPLDASIRNFMEPRFGVDFSRVRLHTDSLAAKSATAIGARAFTAGKDIVFGSGQYMPGSQATLRLLAHELTHVVQQSRLYGASDGKIPSIQRQVQSPVGGAGAQGAQLRDEYIVLACNVIADIRRAVEEGRTWWFEDESLLQGEELLRVNQPNLVDERQDMFQELIRGLNRIIQDLEFGALVPSAPASRRALMLLWANRTPESIQALARRWVFTWRRERSPSGALVNRFPSIGWYIFLANSPPGMLQPASLPTSEVVGCIHSLPPEQSPIGGVTPDDLGLSRDSVIFISRSGSVVTGWDWEPRDQSHTEASRPFGPYEWRYDQSAGRVFIVLDGQQVNLLRNGRVAYQR